MRLYVYLHIYIEGVAKTDNLVHFLSSPFLPFPSLSLSVSCVSSIGPERAAASSLAHSAKVGATVGPPRKGIICTVEAYSNQMSRTISDRNGPLEMAI